MHLLSQNGRLGCPRKLVKGCKRLVSGLWPQYTPFTSRLCSYNPFTNQLLTSTDIRSMHSDCLLLFSRQILPHAEIDAGAGGPLQNLFDLEIRGLHEHSHFLINTKLFFSSSVSVSTKLQQTSTKPKPCMLLLFFFPVPFFRVLQVVDDVPSRSMGKISWKASSVMSSVSQALDKTGASGLARLVGNETAVDEENATLEIPNLDFPSFLGKPAIRLGGG